MNVIYQELFYSIVLHVPSDLIVTDIQVRGDKTLVESGVFLEHLPDEIREYLESDEFTQSCKDRFEALDVDESETLSAKELFPVVVDLLNNISRLSVTERHCQRLLSVIIMMICVVYDTVIACVLHVMWLRDRVACDVIASDLI